MANLTNQISSNFIENALPKFGVTPLGERKPRWVENLKGFICDDYQSAAGHYYYKVVRFCDRLVMVEKAGKYHNWTYLDGLEIYSFNGTQLKLIQERQYDKVFYDKDFIHDEFILMVSEYFRGLLKMEGCDIKSEQLEEKTESVVEDCYKSFLAGDYDKLVNKIIPQIEK